MKNKAIVLDADFYRLAEHDGATLHLLTIRTAFMCQAMVEYLRWSTRWKNVIGDEFLKWADVAMKELQQEYTGASELLFKFENCTLYVSYDAGQNWIAIPGWDTFAPECFTGSPGADGTPGVDGADGLPGAPGAPGAPGEPGCSPFVWVETRPSDDHKILQIDNDCDEVNEFSIDLTVEASADPDRYWQCRFARAIAGAIAHVILGAEIGALPVWSDVDESIFMPIFINTFSAYGALQVPGSRDGFENACLLLWSEGYQYNADLADALQDPAVVDKAIEDIYWTFDTPELTLTNLIRYLERVQSLPEEVLTPVQTWIQNFIFALSSDQIEYFSRFVWHEMGYPRTENCITYNKQWVKMWSAGDFQDDWTYIRGQGTAFGAEAELFLQSHLLQAYIELPYPTDIFLVHAEATVIANTGAAQVRFFYGYTDPQGNAVLGENIDDANPVRHYELEANAAHGVTKIQIEASDIELDGGIIFTKLILMGNGNSPFA